MLIDGGRGISGPQIARFRAPQKSPSRSVLRCSSGGEKLRKAPGVLYFPSGTGKSSSDGFVGAKMQMRVLRQATDPRAPEQPRLIASRHSARITRDLQQRAQPSGSEA